MSELAVGSLAGLAANSYVIDVASGSSLDLSNGATLPAGSIVDVKSVLKTDTFSASVAAGANVAVTDLSITHTLQSASNKLLISAYFGAATSSGVTSVASLAVADDGTLIGVGDAASSRTRTIMGGVTAGDTTDNLVGRRVAMPAVTFLYAPGDTASHTYTVRAVNLDTGTLTLYVNRNRDNDDAAYSPTASSGFVIQEVAG